MIANGVRDPGPNGAGPLGMGAKIEAKAAGAVDFSLDFFRQTSGLEMHRLLAQVLPGADAVLVRALAEDLAGRELPDSEWPPVWNAVAARWVALDAPEAMAWAKAQDAGFLQSMKVEKLIDSLSNAVLLAWARVDPTAAAASMNLSDGREVYGFYAAWGENDPGSAFKHFREGYSAGRFPPLIFLGEHSGDSSSLLLSQWAGKEPESALAFISANFPDRADFWNFLANGWSIKDPAGCGKWMITLSGEQRKEAFLGLASAASENPAGVALILNQFPLSADTGAAGLALAEDWAKQAPAEAQAWVCRWFPEGQARRNALARVAGSVAEKDLSAAVSVMDQAGWENWDAEEERSRRPLTLAASGSGEVEKLEEAVGDREWRTPDSIMESLLGRLGREDPALGIRCFAKADADSKRQVLEYFVPPWFQREPEAALRWLAAIPASQVGLTEMGVILDHFSDFPPDAMRDWAVLLPAGPLSEALTRLSVRGSPEGDPEKALAELPFTDPAGRAAATEEIVRKWAESSPREALDHWRNGPEPVSPAGLAAIVSAWTAEDPAAASAWTASLPPGAERDGAIQGMITSLSDLEGNPDLPAAVVWSLDLSDPAARVAALRRVLPELAGRAASLGSLAEAREALGRLGALPEKDRQDLLKLLDP